MVERSPWDPEFNNSEVGVAWEDERLPKVESKGWEEESSAPDRSAHPDKVNQKCIFLNNKVLFQKCKHFFSIEGLVIDIRFL